MDQDRGELWVLGNGPSLKEHPLPTFSNNATLGMNAAYRYWRRIDWRPTYYCCLDDELIETHKAAIVELIEENRIQRFFLTARILQDYPDLVQNPKVNYLDEFVLHWHRTRGERFGLRYINHQAFKTNAPDMLTTGAYAVRFGVYMGYHQIRLLGVDLSYQTLTEAREVEGTQLIMDSTPTENPNYFFDDYQAVGDRFNVANPETHGRELHLHSFITLRDDFVENALSVNLVNASLRSKLFSEAVLPFAPVGAQTTARASSSTSAVVLEMERDAEGVLDDLFWLWSEPAFFPMLDGSGLGQVDLIFSVESERVPNVARLVARLSKRYPRVLSCFGDVRVRPSSRVFQDHALSELMPKQSAEPIREVNQYGVEYDNLLVLSENTIPMTCDWLQRVLIMGGEPTMLLGLSERPASIEAFVELRTSDPEAVFLNIPGIWSRIGQLRDSLKMKSLEGLIFAGKDDLSEAVPRPPRESWLSGFRRLLGRANL
ncbi:MAG: hypothetical protein ABJH52_15630 [Henriciella sp.]